MFDDEPSDTVQDLCDALIVYAEKKGHDVLHEIDTVQAIDDELEKKMQAVVEEFLKERNGEEEEEEKSEKAESENPEETSAN